MVAEQDVDVSHLPGVGDPSGFGAEKNTSLTVIAGKFSFRVYLWQLGVDYGVVDRRFAVVYLRLIYGQSALNWYVLYEKFWASFALSKFGGRTHGYAVAVSVLQALVHPVLGVGRQVFRVQFSGGHQDLSQSAVYRVSVGVNVAEIVVKLHELELVVGVLEWLQVPKSNIV